MTEKQLRTNVVATAQAYMGTREGSPTHHKLVDTYNSYTPRARGYKLQYTDDWCAGTVGAVAVMCGLTDIIPMEVSVPKMVELAREKGIWVEDDGYTPAPGDLIVFNWRALPTGETTTGANHVGIVAAVKGGKIITIEGNMANAVGTRTLAIDSRYIRGFIAPDYASRADKPKLDYAQSWDEAKEGTYTVIAGDGRRLRTGASIKKEAIEHLPIGSKVTCYGYHTGKWLYVVSEAGNTGFCHRVNLRKDK